MRFFVTVLAWNVQRWEYKDDNGWRRYAPNVAAEVEQAYNERFKGIRLRITRHKYVLGWCVPCAEDERWTEKNFSSLSICCFFLCCRDNKVMLYVVDFSTSKQTNENTKWVNSPKTHAYDDRLSTPFHDLVCRYQREIRCNERTVVFPPPKKLILLIPKAPAPTPAPAPPPAQYNSYPQTPAPAPYSAPAPSKYTYNPEPAKAPQVIPAQVLAVISSTWLKQIITGLMPQPLTAVYQDAITNHASLICASLGQLVVRERFPHHVRQLRCGIPARVRRSFSPPRHCSHIALPEWQISGECTGVSVFRSRIFLHLFGCSYGALIVRRMVCLICCLLAISINVFPKQNKCIFAISIFGTCRLCCPSMDITKKTCNRSKDSNS